MAAMNTKLDRVLATDRSDNDTNTFLRVTHSPIVAYTEKIANIMVGKVVAKEDKLIALITELLKTTDISLLEKKAKYVCTYESVYNTTLFNSLSMVYDSTFYKIRGKQANKAIVVHYYLLERKVDASLVLTVECLKQPCGKHSPIHIV